MRGGEGIILSGKERVISAPLHTYGKRYVEISVYLVTLYNKVKNIEISMYLYADNRKVTRKFPCTITQITWKEEHGNFHAPS